MKVFNHLVVMLGVSLSALTWASSQRSKFHLTGHRTLKGEGHRTLSDKSHRTLRFKLKRKVSESIVDRADRDKSNNPLSQKHFRKKKNCEQKKEQV